MSESSDKLSSYTKFNPNTILRYYPLDGSAHYTAIVLNDNGNLIEVKRGEVKEKHEYDDIESWLESIPDQPTISNLIINQKMQSEPSCDEKEHKKEDSKQKSKKVKKDAPLKISITPQCHDIPAIAWCIHVYRIIKEANPKLLKQTDVIEAFNEWMNILIENQKHVHSIIPIHRHKYSQGIDIDANPVNDPLKGMCYIRMNCVSHDGATGKCVFHRYYYQPRESSIVRQQQKSQEQYISDCIVKGYRKLLNLIRADVIPYMNKMMTHKIMKQTDKKIEMISNKIERIQEAFEKNLDKRLKLIEKFKKSHQCKIDVLYKQLSDITSL